MDSHREDEFSLALRNLDEGVWDVTHISEYVKKQHSDCPKQCICQNRVQFMFLLKNFMMKNSHLMLMLSQNLRSTRHNLEWDELTIREPEAEDAIDLTRRTRMFDNRITRADTKRFCQRFTEIFLREIDNSENYNEAQHHVNRDVNPDRGGNHHRDPVEQCTCVQWLEKMFPRIRFDAISRLYRFVKNHNTLAVALLVFTIQNEFNQQHDLEAMRLRLNPPGDFWEKVRRLVTKGFMRDRARWVRHNRYNLLRPIELQYNAVMQELRREFPLFFGPESGKFDKDVFDKSDPGDLFGCLKCRHEFPIATAIVCQPTYRIKYAINIKMPERRQVEMEHRICRNCLRKIVDKLKTVPAPEEGRLYMECQDPSCANPIVIDAETKRFLPRRVRHRLREMIVERLLIKNGLTPSLVTDCCPKHTAETGKK
uniref:Uncharacterized protein n=1 Tax=Acrobeloides nanus TaxID=290746 RepID=A0A914DUU4_9BILA